MGRISEEVQVESKMAKHNSQLVYHDEERLVYIAGDICESVISTAIIQLLALSKRNPNKPINLIISTYGGSIDEMFALYDTIKLISAPVHTVGLGKIMSAGVLLLSSGVKEKRLIGRNTRIMVHPVWGGAVGNVFDAKNELDEMKRLQDQMTNCLAKETGKSVKDLNALMESRIDTYLTSDEAIEFGIVDKIID
jgi:ATP-dependent Clp protease protease subunit